VASGANGSAVTAVPNTGYRFVRWSDGVMTASRTDTNVTGDITVTAIFAHSNPAAVKDWPLYE
jgi:Na+/H+-dicarboxylate symporter